MADETARFRKETNPAKAGNTSGIMDITDTPDVAVWSKEIRNNVHVPSDKVIEPSKVASTTLHVEQEECKLIDPTGKKQVARVATSGTQLNDESDLQ